MIKNYTSRLIIVLISFTGVSFLPLKFSTEKKETSLITYADSWIGTISYTYTIIDKRLTEGEIKTEFELLRNTTITITSTGNRKGHATINHSMYRREKSDAPFATTRYIQITEAKETGTDEGDVDVDIEPGYDNKKYYLKTSGPQYKVQSTSSFWTSTGGFGLGPPQTNTVSFDGISIDVPDQSFGRTPNEISGSYVIYSSATHYVAVSWRLVKRTGGGLITNTGKPTTGNPSTNNNPGGNQNTSTTSNPTNTGINHNVSLIVTPENYEGWKPAAGDNAAAPGNKEKIGLLLQSIGTPIVRAVSFELKLFSTSRKGSIAADTQDPQDIRFLPQPNAFVSDDGQLIKIPCTDGITGEVTLGSYHDRASTILVADAILNNGGRIRGVLFSTGITDIPIPKIKTP
jgi:hypothetical protein